MAIGQSRGNAQRVEPFQVHKVPVERTGFQRILQHQYELFLGEYRRHNNNSHRSPHATGQEQYLEQASHRALTHERQAILGRNLFIVE